MTDTERVPAPDQPVPGQPAAGQPAAGQPVPGQPVPGQPVPGQSGAAQIADAVLDRIGTKVSDTGPIQRPQPADSVSVDQAIALRDQAPEMYDLWLKIAKDKAATANYVERAPYEVPERLAQQGRPRALGALVIVLAFCGYLAWLGGPGPYIGGLIALVDLVVMFGMFFGLRPERLPDSDPHKPPPPQARRRRF
jgi:hypothetical protein